MRAWRLVVFLFVVACDPAGMPDDAGFGGDANLADGGQTDTRDGGLGDAGRADAGRADAGRADAGRADGGAGAELCPPSSCDAPPPTYEPEAEWRHSIASPITTSQGSARHRGRDLILPADAPQWAIGKFAYGFADDDLEDEDVDVYLLRGCGAEWERLGTATTTDDGDEPHPTTERVEDDGGRVYFRIPDEQRLGPGRHRIHFVVRGDHTSADMFIEVLEGGERFVVSDVDGTLTESETAEWSTVFSGPSPAVNPGAPEALAALAERGYRILYLTARPDWLTTRTHEWVRERGLPPGLVHTTLGGTGALGGAAAAFKSEELSELAARLGEPPYVGIGNKASDAEAYGNVGIDPDRRFLYRLDEAFTGVDVEDYLALVPVFEAYPHACP